MKLKYYLRGMGIGIILTAIVMGFALGGRKATLSNAQIIERAKALGMVEQSEGVLSETQNDQQEAKANDSSTSNKTLDTIREEIPKEDNQELASADTSAAEVDTKKEESTTAQSEADRSRSEASDSSKKDSSAEAKSVENTDGKKDDAVDTANAGRSTSTEAGVAASREVVETAVPETPVAEPKPEPATATASEPASTATSEAASAQASVHGKTVTIPGGLGSEAVAALLVREGFVDNAVSFNQYLVTTGKDRTIRSGTKVIPDGATYEEIANIITKG